MANTINLGLTIMEAGQAQKHVTFNEALLLLDAVVQPTVVNAGVNTPPASPADGDRWIIGSAPTGAWAGRAQQLAVRRSGAWVFLVPRDGWHAYNRSTSAWLAFSGGAWGLVQPSQLPLLGVNATPDLNNRLSVAAPAILLNHEGAGHQVKVNKAAAGETASLLFQTGFAGRAEMGTAGNDDFSIKVSPNGSTYFDAMIVDRNNGRATFPRGAMQEEVTVMTASGNYDVPPWASTVEIVCIGGGAGGGSGRQGAAATVRSGGGGGSAGAMNRETFLASEIASVLVVTVGLGGAGGLPASAIDSNGSPGLAGEPSQITSNGVTILQAGGGNFGAGGNAAAAAGGSSPSTDIPVGTGGGSSSTGALGTGGLTGNNGPGGGGSGGGITTGNAASPGANGGFGNLKSGTTRRAQWGLGGPIGGVGGNGAAKQWTRGTGAGGGGGGGNGGAGGSGGAPGGGGGGGGGALNGTASGAGGAGARGEVVLIARG